MSSFMAAMTQELREKGRIDGFGGMSSAAWEQEVREYEARLAEQKLADRRPFPSGERDAK